MNQRVLQSKTGSIRTVYEFQLNDLHSVEIHVWRVIIDALTGEILELEDLVHRYSEDVPTVYRQPFQYRVRNIMQHAFTRSHGYPAWGTQLQVQVADCGDPCGII